MIYKLMTLALLLNSTKLISQTIDVERECLNKEAKVIFNRKIKDCSYKITCNLGESHIYVVCTNSKSFFSLNPKIVQNREQITSAKIKYPDIYFTTIINEPQKPQSRLIIGMPSLERKWKIQETSNQEKFKFNTEGKLQSQVLNCKHEVISNCIRTLTSY